MLYDTAVRVENVTKIYRIYERPVDRLTQMATLGRVRRFREYPALANVSLSVRKGETVGIIGRNGSGKSTLLKVIGGVLEPTTGLVETNGKLMALQLGTGFNPEFSGRENVLLEAAIMGMSSDEVQVRLPSIVEFANIGDFINQPVKTYSSGMYTRLAFSVAAHMRMDILLVDEVLAVGDLAFTQKCMRFIQDFKNRGTLLFCGHDLGSVMALCETAVWIDGGVVRAVGETKEVCDEYRRSIELDGDSTGEMKFGGLRGQRTKEVAPASDHRSHLLRQSNLVNEINVFDFDHHASWFGQRMATIIGAVLKEPSGAPLTALVGGEDVVFEINAKIHAELHAPIFGFMVRDRHGQVLFGDNTYLTYREEAPQGNAGDIMTSRFFFQMPYLPTGDYSISVALADGAQETNVQQHWIDDALFFNVASSHVVKGLVGIPMQSIEILTATAAAEESVSTVVPSSN